MCHIAYGTVLPMLLTDSQPSSVSISKSSTKKPPTVNSSVEGKTSIRKINYNVSNNFTSNSGWKLIKFNRFKQ